MKKITYKNYFGTLLLAIAALSGCKKDFLDKPPESAVTDASFYQN